MTRDELRERLAMTLAGLVVVKAPVTEMVDALFLGLQAAGLAMVPVALDDAMKLAGVSAMVDLVEATNERYRASTAYQRGLIGGMSVSCNSVQLDAAYRAMLAAGDLLGKPDADPR